MNWRTGHYKRIKTIVALLLCTVFIFQVFNKAVYTHAHIGADGSIISHAHPYNKQSDTSPFKKHHHSKAEYAFLQQLKLLFSAFLVLFAFGLFTKKFVYSDALLLNYITCYSPVSPGRSPPFNIFHAGL